MPTIMAYVSYDLVSKQDHIRKWQGKDTENVGKLRLNTRQKSHSGPWAYTARRL